MRTNKSGKKVVSSGWQQIDSRDTKSKTYGENRVCAICGKTKLSKYNPCEMCAGCYMHTSKSHTSH